MPTYQRLEAENLSPYDTKYFDQVNDQVSRMQNYQLRKKLLSQTYRSLSTVKTKEIHQIDVVIQKVMPFQYRYLQKERKGLQRNTQHCYLRNEWCKSEIKKSWQIAVSNRALVLRSLARANILKKQADQWLSSIDDNVLSGQVNHSYTGRQIQQEQKTYNQSAGGQNDLRGSKLIDKYNDILCEYYHKI